MSNVWLYLMLGVWLGGSAGFVLGGLCASAKVHDLEEQLWLASRRHIRLVK